eukprot:354271_1
MISLLILFSTIYICSGAILSGSDFELTVPHDAWGDIIECTDNVDCNLRCYGAYACESAVVKGPKNAALTITCNSAHDGVCATWIACGGACNKMDVIANTSTALDINVYHARFELYWSNIFAPNNGRGGGYSTNIICGLQGANSPTPTNDVWSCGENCKLWATEGWNDVYWSYSGSNSFALLDDPYNNQRMVCGEYGAKYDYDHEYTCLGWSVQNDNRYGCNRFSECDDYVISTTTPTKVPTMTAPTRSPSQYPTNNPTSITTSPTTNAPTLQTTPSPTHERKYILVPSASKLTWYQAEDFCQSIYSSHLATIITDSDYSNVLDMMESENMVDAWIGLNDRFEEGQWAWADGSQCFISNDGSCSQFWSNPGNEDLNGNYNADCVLLRNNNGQGTMNEMLCDEVISTYADGYLCNDETSIADDVGGCKAIYLDGVPTFPLDVCLVADNNEINIASRISCNDLGEKVFQEWSDSSDCSGKPDNESPYALGEYVDCDGTGAICDHAVIRLYYSTSCVESATFTEYPIIVNNCYQTDINIWVQYECDSELKILKYLQYSNNLCTGSSTSQIVYKDGDCDSSGHYVDVTCDGAVTLSFSIALWISSSALIFIQTFY